MKVPLKCLCGAVWSVDLELFIGFMEKQWEYWRELNIISGDTNTFIHTTHKLSKLTRELKKKGYLQCMCVACQKRTTHNMLVGEDISNDIAFTGKI